MSLGVDIQPGVKPVEGHFIHDSRELEMKARTNEG